MITWDELTTTREEARVIVRIAARAYREIPGICDNTGLAMDLEACHGCGCPLDLEGLLAAKPGDFAHDLCGIRRHVDHETGRLGDGFLPRFAKRST